MWHLSTARGQQVPIRRLPATLGSDRRADVVLPHVSVKPLHARLEAEPDGRLRIEAIGDAGVGVADKRVRAARLAGGEVLTVGRVRLRVEAPAAGDGRPAEPETRRETAAGPASKARPGPRPRTGLLQTDLSQLSLGTRAGLAALLVVAAAGLVWGLSALIAAV